MLDSFEIITTSGVVLWSKTLAPVSRNAIDSLIRDVFIENRPAQQDFRKDKYTLKWTVAKDLGLIFVAVYQSILHLTWVEKLLENVKILFTDLYKDQLQVPHTTAIDCPFDNYFDRQVQELEATAGPAIPRAVEPQISTDISPPSSTAIGDEVPNPQFLAATHIQRSTESDTSADVTPLATPDSSRPASPAPNHLVTGKSAPGKASRRARKLATATSSVVRDASASKLKAPGKTSGKAKRTWGIDGVAGEGDDTVLDYSASDNPAPDAHTDSGPTPDAIARDSWTTRTSRGEYILKDLDDEMTAILAKSKTDGSDAATSGLVGSSLNSISSMFRSIVGGKSLTAQDLQGPMKAMREQLTKKNVAPPAATRLCDMVQADLIDTKTSSFQSIEAAVRSSMERALAKILSPTSNLDLIRAAQDAKERGRPYVISMVGVNGVGKSTTLSKLAFLLLNNNYRVLICAADTFRSGAVEQLRVHVRNLKELTSRGEGFGSIELFERGYGGDAANIARAAVKFAATPAADGSSGDKPAFDVVLIDTAGRRHNDNSLMASLAKFAQMAQPDKILMVGEALVGTDSVAQARRFNESFGTGRHLDGFVISKCDTVGDMVGTLVSMVDATGAPVVALGVGQHYGDLRALNVAWAVRLLMS